ncbi:putative oxidoreductase [Rhodococcus rhodochrous ATCC 21198]|nr:LLM class F420-dependent oxidoreductase [Rhodococcus aetherivorans]ETT25388.1 putative oxidoreductase [Rhodococcus rhodochrous ATCC 21198]NGP29087.1 LLM class F420-dependent oxidoreductase [Rhodococcus aetherivorans]
MKLGIQPDYAGDFRQVVDEIVELESVGLDIAFVAEAYSFDAFGQLGYLAARTSTVQLGTGVVPIYTRTPSLLAMTAAGMDYVSGGRFVLGLGASGPQVIEGFHGVPYDAPLQRTREVVDICRAVWRREKLEYAGRKYTIPLPADRGTGLGKPLKLINQPVRERIPIMIAALGPKNVALAAEIAEAWEPVFFFPEHAHRVWGDALAEGKAKRDPALGELEVVVNVQVGIGDNVAELRDRARPHLALYLGGMGAKGKNFYNQLARTYGFEREAETVQDLYLAGRKKEAEAAIPDELIDGVCLVGPRSHVAERLAAFEAAGVTTINIMALEDTRAGRLASTVTLRELTRRPA